MTNLEETYQYLPGWAQTIALNAYAFRLHRRRRGTEFDDLVESWEGSQWWDSERLRTWQNRRLRKLVRYAYDRIPFYRDRWQKIGLDPREIRGVKDLPKLPILEKEDVRQAGRALTPADNANLSHGHTSGTTGSPLSLWYDRRMEMVNDVADWRQKAWAGMEPGDWLGLFLGRVIVPTDETDPPFWRTNYVHNQVWFSAFHMSPDNLDHYVREIRRRDLRFLEGYPSTLFILAKHVLARNERLPMRAVLTSSETLHEVQRTKIERAFDCEVFDFYGLAERVIFAGECDEHQGKHLFQEYGITEIVDDEGRPVPGGETGWLTGTSLWNRGMPLIRYRTSDLSWREGACECGRSLQRIASVTTKAEDVVVTPDGRFVSPSVLTHPFKPFDEIKKSQVIQERPDQLRIRLVASDRFDRADEKRLTSGLRERLGEEIEIEVEYQDEIPPDSSGKFRWVISHVSHSCQVAWDSAATREVQQGPAASRDASGPSEHQGE